MKTLTPHIPSFVDIEPQPDEQFNTVKDLLKLKFVKRFSGSAIALSENRLIAVKENGRYWLVIGKIDDITELDIPNWIANEMPNPIITI